MTRGEGGGVKTPFYLSSAPLLEAVRLRGGLVGCGVRYAYAHGLEEAFRRAQRSPRLTVWAADELAIKLLGEHPMLVWGDEWLYGPQEPVSAAVRRRRGGRVTVPQEVALWPLDVPVDELAQRRRRTSCRPGWGPCRRRHDHASRRRSGVA